MQICVVYLAWGPLGPEPVERFARSYLQHPAGIRHRLVIARKGTATVPWGERVQELVGELGAGVVRMPSRGLDLDTYLAAAEQLAGEAFCFLNTSSEILAEGWLQILHQGLASPGVGMVGATGSWESALTSAPRPLKPLLRRRYPPFPNPHLRTNAFMLRAQALQSLRWPAARRKSRALALESGCQGITRQIVDQGLTVLVAGRSGAVYAPEAWPDSRTFRSGEQEDLLVADNRTRQYAAAEPPERARLAGLAWGYARAAGVSQPPARARQLRPGS